MDFRCVFGMGESENCCIILNVYAPSNLGAKKSWWGVGILVAKRKLRADMWCV
jgi:hypothetical protein